MTAPKPAPEWCGQCDKKTRELITDAGPKRCACHPLANVPLAQFRACPQCQSVIYKWDTAPCEYHTPIRQAS